MLAITLLNNTSLDENTLTQCRLQLTSLADSRSRCISGEKNTQMNVSHYQKLKDFVSRLLELEFGRSSVAGRKTALKNFYQRSVVFVEEIHCRIE